MTIKILPPEIASQIAAGEVIERPASVVKELLENALDAGASVIQVTVEDAGKRLIEVADDGCGIPAEELPLSVERHATSKLDSADDLFNIRTLGFRGEALSSVGSVSRLTITSRPAQAEEGVRLLVNGGKVASLQRVGTPIGTIVRVENLFFNVPARLKFLKSDVTERRNIDNQVSRYALAYPHVRFELGQDDRTVLQTSGNGDSREVLATLYGVDIARQMLQVIAEDDNLRVDGFISPTSLTRSNRREIIFFINGRPVKDAALSAALMKGYHTLLMVGRYPRAVIFLQMPPELVDVNVHPTKAEVRFRDRDHVFVGLQGAVRRALLAHTPVPEVNGQLRWTPANTGRETDTTWKMTTNDQFASRTEAGSGVDDLPHSQPSLPTGRVPLLRLVGQVATSYLVAEGPDGLYLIDQHAAHERVLFERFMSQRDSEIPAQSLLMPATVELPPANARLLTEQLPMLDSLGFEVESFGPNTFLVRAIPGLLGDLDPAAALRVLVEDFEEDEAPFQDQIEDRIIARVCKRAAIKSGQAMSHDEQQALLSDLEACQSPRTCPHGRPTMIHLSVDLLERQFGRRGAR
jgi:DNA mismatch repair protein MutL